MWKKQEVREGALPDNLKLKVVWSTSKQIHSLPLWL